MSNMINVIDKIEKFLAYGRSRHTKSTKRYSTPTGVYYLPRHAYGDVIVQEIIKGNVFEPEIVECAREFIKPGTSVLDIGANFGQMSVLFSGMGSNITVYSFEASAFVGNLLKLNTSYNCGNRVRPIIAAVHNSDGQLLNFPEPDFDNSEYQTYGSFGINYNKKNNSEETSILTMTIDSMKIKEKISLMKIDIQGGDLFAMQGAVNTIMKHRMPIIFEYEYRMPVVSFQEYVDFVRSIDYSFERVISGYNYLILPNEYCTDGENSGTRNNIDILQAG
jgi:FkbM family methyltransferase